MMRKILLLLMLWGGIATVETAQARHHVELESTYLGDGWFRYQLRSIDDPFFRYFNLVFLTVAFPSFTEFGADPAEWTSVYYTNSSGPRAGWEYPYGSPGQRRPYEQTFFARTEHRHFKRRLNAQFGMSLSFFGGYHGQLASDNIVGFFPIHALVPCRPEEADGSPTNLLERFTAIDLPDIQIGSLVRSGSNIVGFSFTYPEASTVLLQGTRDFQTWTNIGYVYGNAGTTTFQSSTVLNPYGNFFRLVLAAEGHASLLTNNAGSVSVAKSAEAKEQPMTLGNYLTLRFLPSGTNELTFSWPTVDTNYVLESAPFVSSANWRPIATSPVILNNNWVFTNSIGPGNQFFRLRKP